MAYITPSNIYFPGKINCLHGIYSYFMLFTVKTDLCIPWFESAAKSSRWLLGVSGGADSVAMLQLMIRGGFRNLVICHLNHRLRGRASSGDARFVKALAAKLDFPCESRITDVAKLAHGRSLEATARDARHAFFADCARKWKCRRVVLAHHADDQAETMLWNLIRGSQGLKGMEAFKQIRVGRMTLEIHRPLLGIRKSALVDWLRESDLRWREDATNAEAFTIRNRLRNEVIPLLNRITGRDAVASLASLAHDSWDAAEIREWAVGQANAIDPAGRIHLPALRALPRAMRRAVLAAYLGDSKVEISRDLIDRCVALTESTGPRAANLPGGRVLRRRAGRLWIDG